MMNTNKQGFELTKNAVIIQSRVSKAIQKEILSIEKEGYEVPSISVSVKGDIREEWKPEKCYVKNYGNFINYIEDTHGLSITEKGIIFELSRYITFESNLLVTKKGLPLNRKDLETILQLSHNAIEKHINVLVAKSILAKVKVGRNVQYYINPNVAYMGNRIDVTLKELFNIPTKSK